MDNICRQCINFNFELDSKLKLIHEEIMKLVQGVEKTKSLERESLLERAVLLTLNFQANEIMINEKKIQRFN